MDTRNYYVEAQAILAGESLLLPERAHLEALQEHADCAMIRLSNGLERLKREALSA